MTERLPIPGGDLDNWGDILNRFHRVSHKADGHIQADYYGTSDIPAFTSRHARGTAAAPLRTKANDVLGRFEGHGAYAVDDSSAATFGNSSAQITYQAEEDHTATAMGGRIHFSTTPPGGTTPTERFRVGGGNNGIDFYPGTFSTYQMRLKNAAWVVGRNAADSANINLFRFNSSDQLEFGSAATPVLATGTAKTVDNVIAHLQTLGLARQS